HDPIYQFLYPYCRDHQDLHSFPTRRSSDLLKGTKTRTAEQIANEIEAVGGSISSESGNNSFGVSLDVMKPDLKLGVDLLSDVLLDRKSTRLNSSHVAISYAVFCLKKKNKHN